MNRSTEPNEWPSRESPAAPAPPSTRLAPRSVAERWAMLVLSTMRAEFDPKTVSSWARAVGVSRSSLCECCRLVHVSPHDARDFARVMRAIHRSGAEWQPEAFLDLADARTLKKLMARAGLSLMTSRTPTLPEFFDGQQWIPMNNAGFAVLRALLENGDNVRPWASGRTART